MVNGNSGDAFTVPVMVVEGGKVTFTPTVGPGSKWPSFFDCSINGEYLGKFGVNQPFTYPTDGSKVEAGTVLQFSRTLIGGGTMVTQVRW
jgi:hypothetical protein